MPRGKSNGSEAKGAGNSAYLIKVNEAAKTAEVVRLVVGEENERGETLVLKRDHAVKALTDAAFPGKSGFLKARIAQNIRSQLKNAPEFENFLVNIDIETMESKPGKPQPEDDEDEDEDEEVTEQPSQPAY